MTMVKDLTILEFIEAVDSDKPAPGGGSVAALVGGLACALARMYASLSISKKKFQSQPAEIKDAFVLAFDTLQAIEHELLRLVDEDTEIFQRLMEAMRLPKEDEQQMVSRCKAIEYATKDAIESPLAMLTLCYDGIKQLRDMVGYGNANATSDIGVAVACFEAAAKGAYLNVIINLSGMKDDELAYVYEKKAKIKLDQILYESFAMFAQIRDLIRA